MSEDRQTYRILSSGRVLSSEVSFERNLTNERSSKRKNIDDSPFDNQRKKLLFQAVSEANKSVQTKSTGIIKVTNPDGSTECLTKRNLRKTFRDEESMKIDLKSLSKLKVRVRNEFFEGKSPEAIENSNEPIDDDDDELVVVVNNEYEGSEIGLNNSGGNENFQMDEDSRAFSTSFDEIRQNENFKPKSSFDEISDSNDFQQEQNSNSPRNPVNVVSTTKKQKRCRFWPDCQTGELCEFVHPTQSCTHFPNCLYGNECLFIHPNCRFSSACTRPNCPFFHSVPNSGNQTGRNLRIDSSTPCKFGLQCMRPNCAYAHPLMTTYPARSHKWVNNKWRASDDIPILPPAPLHVTNDDPLKTMKDGNQGTN